MSQRKICYFDNNATTRVAPEVIEAMVPFLSEYWGNPSSSYHFGKQVAKHIESARSKVAALINADPREVIYTSCGTESNNSAIHSALATQPGKRHVVTTAVEHSANIKFCEYLRKRGYEVTLLPVEPDGSLDIHLLEKTIRPDTAIVSVMWANNETGVIFPLEEVAAICRSKGVLCHTDAVQTPGKLKIDVTELGVDFLSLSAHKLHAPKGIGMLYIKRRTKYQPYVVGGGQEQGRRGGTENVANMVAFGRAAGAGHGEPGRREHAHPGPPRSHGEINFSHDTQHLSQREPRQPVAKHQQHFLQFCGSGGNLIVAGPGRHLCFERLGLYDRFAGSVACAGRRWD